MRTVDQNPVPGVSVVVWDENRILLVQRGKAPYQGQWTLPGGMIELGETVEMAARREIREECGIEISAPELLTNVDVIKYVDGGDLEYHYVLLTLVARVLQGPVIASDDAQAAGWFTHDEWQELALAEQTEAVLELALQRLKL